ncbi:MAG: DoxX family protein [Bauldia sp.]|nr:MAG: DoxX family protein [Bauldia sp.]
MIALVEAVNGLFRRLEAPLALLARLLLAFIFVDSGYGKIPNYANELTTMASHGVATAFLIPVIVLELGGGIAFVLGFLTRLAALALAVFSVIAAFLFFPEYLTNDDQWISVTNNLAIAGGMLGLAAFGPGRWSADAALFGTTR